MLVSSPEYSGLASILQEKLLDRWKWFQILRIFRVFPWLVIENAVFVVDCPNYSGYSSVRVGKTGLDLAPAVMVHYAKICHPRPCVSCLVAEFGVRTKCGHFSKLYANNYVWKNVKIKINLGPVVLTGRILQGKRSQQ